MSKDLNFWSQCLIILISVVYCATTSIQAKQCQTEKPNIIIMLMDDMGWGDLGTNGNPSQETPNMDRMAKEGMQFLDFYSGNPLCSPSRAALLTGRLPIRNGFYTTNIHARNSYTPQEIVGGIPKTEILLQELLADVGYRNMIVGKWHLGHSKPEYLPLNRGFHEFFGSYEVHVGPYDDKTRPNVAVFRNESMIGRYYENIWIDRQRQVGDFLKNQTEEAIIFIQKESGRGNPFFLYWTPDTLHAPTYRSIEYVGRSLKNSSYGDALIQMDDSVGKIMDLIRNDECLHNNTFVFFTSDNGPALISKYDAGISGPFLCGKQTTFEGGFREPALAWWPGKIKPGQKTHQLSSVMDLFQTAVELAGAKMPSNRTYDSHDLRSLMFQGIENDQASIFYYRGDTLMAIRYQAYKAHYWTFSTPPAELEIGINFCPGQQVDQMTTPDLTNHTSSPLLFQIFRDPGERFPILNTQYEYKKIMRKIEKIREEHEKNLEPGEPQLNYCDQAVMNWSPPGCEQINMCLPVPQSKPYLCDWPH